MAKATCAAVLLCAVAAFSACSGGGNPVAPTSTQAAAPVATFTLSGQVTTTTGGALTGAVVQIIDGPNAGRSTVTDTNGNYSITGLMQSGFTVTFSASNFAPTSIAVTLTANRTANAQLAPLFFNMIGAWFGTVTSSGLGASTVCNLSWLVNAQNGGTYSGTYQQSGANGCAQAGTLSGTITQSNVVTYNLTSTTVSNGAVCTDTNVVSNGLLSGRTITVQASFIRRCTSPINLTFAESQTLSLTKQ